MQLKRATFITSLAQLKDFPGRGLPEIAIVGKSNVGKSSMINCLGKNSKLARTSSEPGKTRLINLYNINDALVLTDLPGYGFAKVSREEKMRWAGMIEGYLRESEHLQMSLQLVDIRHKPTADDIDMVNYLRHFGRPFKVVATKCDKLSRAERNRSLPVICRTLAVQPWEVIPFSAVSGEGRDALYALMGEIIGEEDQNGAQ